MVYDIGTINAYGMRSMTRNSPIKCLDFERILELIKRLKPQNVEVGLAEDWSCTSGDIIQNCVVVNDCYFHDGSTWATPTAIIDGEEFDVSTQDPKMTIDIFKNELLQMGYLQQD